MESEKRKRLRTGTRFGIVAATVGFVLLGTGILSLSRSLAARSDAPAAALPQAGADRTVLCLGDSLTRANISADYVEELARRLAGDGVSVVNGGVNGETVADMTARLDDALTETPAPDAVTVLIGTNDANNALNAAGAEASPEGPAEEFRSEYAGLIARLRESTDAGVVLISIPPIGEKPGSPEWLWSERYAMEIGGLAADLGCSYVPFFEALEALIEAGPPDPDKFPDQEDWAREMRRAVVYRLFKGRNYRAVGAASGYRYHSDRLHLNEDAAAILVDALEPAVRAELAGR